MDWVFTRTRAYLQNHFLVFSTGGAPEGSPRREPWDKCKREQAPEGRKKTHWIISVCRPLRGLRFSASNPRLAPWATAAAPQLKQNLKIRPSSREHPIHVFSRVRLRFFKPNPRPGFLCWRDASLPKTDHAKSPTKQGFPITLVSYEVVWCKRRTSLNRILKTSPAASKRPVSTSCLRR